MFSINIFKISVRFAMMLLFTLIFFSSAQAQLPQIEATENRVNKRPGLISMLNLSTEQLQTVKIINRQRQTKMRLVQQRLRTANIQLEEALYTDNLDESLIKTRSEEVSAAQTEVNKTRVFYELAVRKILDPQQLKTFRDMRQQSLPRLQNRPLDPNQRIERKRRRRNQMPAG